MHIKKINISSAKPVICVPIIDKSKDKILETIKSLAGQKIKMVELRLDYFPEIGDKDKLLDLLKAVYEACADMVLMVTLRTSEEGGNFKDTDEVTYSSILNAVVESKMYDIIDVEYRKLRRMHGIMENVHKDDKYVLASFHDFRMTPESRTLFEILDAMILAGADLSKIACMPHSEDDCLRILSVTKDCKRKYPDKIIVTVSMGNLGILSRVTGELFGSAITFASNEKESAPGQIPISDMKKFLSLIHKYSADTGASGIFEENKNKLYLMGYMATGKSTTARILGKKLKIKVIEMDKLLTERLGMSISDYFQNFGEESFREKESELLREIASGDAAIVSCGGGVPLREENRKVMKESGICVVLTASPEVIYERTANRTDRPLLNAVKKADDIRDMMEKRRDIYKMAGDLFVSTDVNSPDKTAELVISNLKARMQ